LTARALGQTVFGVTWQIILWEVHMLRHTQLFIVASLLLLGACSESRLFDTNCSGNGMITNAGYCTDTLHPFAGPWSTR
jgi:hypothetical protein